MFGLGKIAASLVRIANSPARAIEILIDKATGEETPVDDRIISAPLESLAEALDEADA